MSLNILAVDTSMNACGVGVKRADGLFFEQIEAMERGQAERLMPLILEVLGQAGLTLQDVDRFAVTTGPGTFTGLRVGLATVRALAQASGKPAIGVGTFDAITDDPNACVLIETKRNDFYVRAPGLQDACMTPEELSSVLQPGWTLIGDAVTRAVAQNKKVEIASVPLAHMVEIAGKAADKGLPEPVYLRGADVSTARKTAVKIV